MQRILDKLVL